MSERSMINRGASQRADELRENLRGFRDVDTLLAEASRLKREAALEAEQLLTEAQGLADDLLDEAQGKADAIVSDASSAAEATQRRLDSVLGEIESGVRELGGHLEGALRSVNALAQALEGVRTAPEPAASEPTAPLLPVERVEPVAAEEPAAPTEPAVSGVSADAVDEPTTVEHFYEVDSRGGDAGARPLGWLFRATAQG